MVLLISNPYFSFTPVDYSFTFHYGSTYMNYTDEQINSVQYLHSTMVLLISTLLQNLYRKYLIYIPLWFYLYKEMKVEIVTSDKNLHSTMVLLIWIRGRIQVQRFSKFTFHYGSTYII